MTSQIRLPLESGWGSQPLCRGNQATPRPEPSADQGVGPTPNTAGIQGIILTETRVITPAGIRPSQNLWCSIKLWDLTFQVDQNHIFSCLQFKTRDRHEIIQMKGHFYTMTIVTTNPTTNKTTFYYEFSGFLLSDHAVSTYVRQINNSLRYV